MLLKIKIQKIVKPLLILISLFSIYAPFISASEGALPQSNNIQLIIPSFSAKYNILRQGDVVGKATRELTYLDDIHAQYQFNSDIQWFIFSDVRRESTLMRIEGGVIKPTSFTYTRRGTGKDKSHELRFGPEEGKVTNIKKNQVISTELSTDIQDPLSHRFMLQKELITSTEINENSTFSYSVVKGSGRLKEYTYTYESEEDIMLPYGLVKAIKLKQENATKTRVTYAWFAPELNFLLVKLFQMKEGVEQFETQLTSIKTH